MVEDPHPNDPVARRFMEAADKELLQFQNRARILYSMDRDETGLSPFDWTAFRQDPVRYLMICNDSVARRIWAVVQARETPR